MIQSLTAHISLYAGLLSADPPLLNAPPHCPGLWQVQLRSLNQRFFELQLQIPDFCRFAEGRLRQLLQKQLLRGHIECQILYQPHGDAVGGDNPGGYGPNVSPETLENSLLQIQQVVRQAQKLGMNFPLPSALDLLRYAQEEEEREQGLLQANSGEPLGTADPKAREAELETWLCSLLHEACSRIAIARQREAQALLRELQALLQKYQEQCAAAEHREAEVPQYYQAQLQSKLEAYCELFQGPNTAGSATTGSAATGLAQQVNQISQDRLYQELALMLAKGDIREELCRLQTHGWRFTQILDEANQSKSPHPCAKELDFLLQEMNREANTLASKSPLVGLQQIAVQLKLTVEQLREQIRNVL